MQVPFLDLKAQYKQIKQEVIPMITEAMENGRFIGGPQVSSFENEFAEFCETDYCVGVNSGTDALRFALMAVGIDNGDEVITVPNTFIVGSFFTAILRRFIALSSFSFLLRYSIRHGGPPLFI